MTWKFELKHGTIFKCVLKTLYKNENDPLQVTVNITGLPAGIAGAKHGLHVHQNGITVVSKDVATSKFCPI